MKKGRGRWEYSEPPVHMCNQRTGRKLLDLNLQLQCVCIVQTIDMERTPSQRSTLCKQSAGMKPHGRDYGNYPKNENRKGNIREKLGHKSELVSAGHHMLAWQGTVCAYL